MLETYLTLMSVLCLNSKILDVSLQLLYPIGMKGNFKV